MKKIWESAVIEELDVKETQFGPISPETPDGDKTAVFDDNGNLQGWKQQFGEEDRVS